LLPPAVLLRNRGLLLRGAGQRWPQVSNFGNLLSFDASWWRGRVDVVWGSTPCQAFSFAGRRKGLTDKRGNLTLAFVDRVDEIDPPTSVWENVKGVLSDKSNAFGCLLGALAGEDGPLVPPGGRGRTLVMCLDPREQSRGGLFDAQHGGVPQRRERVFLVGSARGGADPETYFLSLEGVRRDTPPRREAREETADLAGGGALSDGGDAGRAAPGRPSAEERTAFGCDYRQHPARPLTAPAAGIRWDVETETMIVSSIASAVDLTNMNMGDLVGTICAEQDRGSRGQGVVSATGPVTHALKAEGADGSEDGSEDGSGRGNPIIAFSCKDAGQDAGDDLAPTLRSMGHVGSHQNAGGQLAVAYGLRNDATRSGEARSPSPDAEGRLRKRDAGFNVLEDTAPTLDAGGPHFVAYASAEAGEAVAMAFAENDRGELRTSPVSTALARKGGKPGQGYPAIVTADAHAPIAIQERAVCENPDAGPDGAGFRPDVAYTLEARTTAQMVAYAGGFQVSESGVRLVDTHATLDANNGPRRHNGVITALTAAMRGRDEGAELELGGEVSNALRGSGGGSSRALALVLWWAEAICARVRRLTPLECERLQGLPDNHTRIRWRGRAAEACPDAPRYRAIGNGLALPDVRWLGARIAHFHRLKTEERTAA
jgi:DNA (cytosine-5)-methyltransferase 1